MRGQELRVSVSGGGQVLPLANGWRFELPGGGGRAYRLAQVADGWNVLRCDLPWRPPLRLSLRGRVSGASLPGTWGFGLWNDPFTAQWGLNGMARRLPTLPQAAWFFHAGAENYLTLRDDLAPNGFLAGVFAARWFPGLLLGVGVPLFALPPLARLLRRLGRYWVREAAFRLQLDQTAWHEYCLKWEEKAVRWFVDGQPVYESVLSPRSPLSLVIWIDNQFAAFAPDGHIKAGALANPPAWMEICDMWIGGLA